MPGLVGIIRRQQYPGLDRDLHVMQESMRHESYYVGDRYVNRDIGLAAAWLAHPGTLGTVMPLVASSKNHLLIIIGEHFQSSSKESESLGQTADCLLNWYLESEHKLCNSLNGWFCGIAVDLGRGRVTLFNDRYGMGRLYFYEGQDEFIFASEAKALLRVRPSLRQIDAAGLAQYLRFGCVMDNRTLFNRVSLLPGAACWTFTHGSNLQKRSYFDFADWEAQPALHPEEFHRAFEDTVSRVFPLYMKEEEDVGLSLTAGLDTRAILAVANKSDRRLPCYTFGGLWGETFDISTARKLADISHLSHEAIKIDENFLREFPDYAAKSIIISDGTHDALGAHDVYFNRVAHAIAPIRLTGKFGSEVVRTRRLIPEGDFPRYLMDPGMIPFLDEARTPTQYGHLKHPLSRTVGEEVTWHQYGRVSVEQSGAVLRTPYMDNDLVKLMYQAPFALRDSRDLQSKYIRESASEISVVPTNMGGVRKSGDALGMMAYGMYWALFKVEYVYLYATPHWLTRLDRKLGALHLECILSGRQKFEGYRIWMKTHLAEYLRDILMSPRARCTDFFAKSWVHKLASRHAAGTHNYLDEIDKILTIELVCSLLLSPRDTGEAAGPVRTSSEIVPSRSGIELEHASPEECTRPEPALSSIEERPAGLSEEQAGRRRLPA